MNEKTLKVLVLGATRVDDLPGIKAIPADVELVFAADDRQLHQSLPGAEVLLSWNFRAAGLSDAWSKADALRWIHWCGAGVDAAMFPALRNSDVILTNARGVFDQPMAEYVLGLIIAMAKSFPQTFSAKSARNWAYQVTEPVAGRRVLIVGVGSIGRRIAQVLNANGLRVTGVGRTAREEDPDFGTIHAISNLNQLLPGADFVINVTPLTDATRNLFSRTQFDAMESTARFINVGRGASVDEAALLTALESESIAGAALDVFQCEPLPEDSPVWDAPNLIISPHMSGDTWDYESHLVGLFLENLTRYRTNLTLHNIVDKAAGFVAT